jgi:hypothetical protein
MDLKLLRDDELIVLLAEIERELNIRKIHFSIGQIGEKLALEFFQSNPNLSNLQLANTGTKNVDAISRNGDRYSIKTSLKAKKTGTIYPDQDNPEKQLFEYLLIVKITQDFYLDFLYRFSWQQFLTTRAWDKRMNAWYVPISEKRLNMGECLFRKDCLE